MKDLTEVWGEDYTMDNTKSKEILGIEYYSTKELALAMVESLIQHGLLPDKRKKK